MSAFERVVVGLDMHQGAANAVLARACELAEPAHIEAVHACSVFHHEHHDYTLGTFETTEALDAAVRRQADEYLESHLQAARDHQVPGPRRQGRRGIA